MLSVVSQVFRLATEYDQILRAVVMLITIFVMYDLARFQWSSEHLFRNYSVLMLPLPLFISIFFQLFSAERRF